jgi:L-threonylcarbamoyladenylate synthase
MQEDIKKATECLKKGGVILYPTDTIWGIGCDATNSTAVRNIFLVKKRSGYKSFVLLAADISMLKQYVGSVPEKALELMKSHNKPLTIVYPAGKNVAEEVVAEDGSVAIRIPKDKFCQSLIKSFGKPIVSTSANISGDNPPAVFKEINPAIISKVDYSVHYRRNDENKGAPSSITKVFSDNSFITIRE